MYVLEKVVWVPLPSLFCNSHLVRLPTAIKVQMSFFVVVFLLSQGFHSCFESKTEFRRVQSLSHVTPTSYCGDILLTFIIIVRIV